MIKQPAAVTPPEPSAAEEPLSLAWRKPSGMIGLSFMNLVLKIITLGTYHFWAKTEVRQRLWSGIRLNDEPLTYTCLLYTSPSPRDKRQSRMPSSA